MLNRIALHSVFYKITPLMGGAIASVLNNDSQNEINSQNITTYRINQITNSSNNEMPPVKIP